MNLRNLSLVSLGLLASINGYASMNLDRMIVYMNPSRTGYEDITVANPEKDKLYLQTEVFRVVNPGEKDEQLLPTTNPDEMKLLTTPEKAIVPAGSRKTMRLVSLEEPKDIEQVYRVTFKPVEAESKEHKSSVRILIAYQALVFVRPENPHYKVSAVKDGKTMTFTNSGNVNVMMRNGQVCSVDNDCSDLPGSKRLYAGQSWTVTLPGKSGKVSFDLFDGREEKKQVF